MKALFALRSKHKLALGILMMVVLLLCGVLAERSFLSRVNETSSSIYNDRLLPATFVYQLSDHLSQRRFLMAGKQPAKANLAAELHTHRQAMDSLVQAFEKTYLVNDESLSLRHLKSHLQNYNRMERKLLAAANSPNQQPLYEQYGKIREELQELSAIQASVGQQLFQKTENLTSDAGVVSQLQVAMLILACLLAQVFIMASKAISSPVKQRHQWN
ncbi:MAG: MCP four helix bundle domain-containing protein [Owenweeksia sp.]|nr:MCP four helix bundle domain-containing protein [Owenweeksia sp.]